MVEEVPQFSAIAILDSAGMMSKNLPEPGIVKNLLDHLPSRKRAELAFVVELIREGFALATARQAIPKLRNAKLLKIILFGSHARGGWVEDPAGRYYSDYDLLIVVDREAPADVAEYWQGTEDRLLAELASGKRLRTEVNFIVHSFDDMNEKLRLGRYFFIDILREGIPLFEEPGHSFVDPQPLPPATVLEEAQGYFEEWFGSACEFFDNFTINFERNRYKNAAFQLHQAVERLYHCLLLVHTLYSPQTHNLNRLRSLTESIDPRLREVWPRDSRFQQRCFELLREAYVKARYSRHYQISTEELEWLGERIELLKDLIGTSCQERIKELGKTA